MKKYLKLINLVLISEIAMCVYLISKGQTVIGMVFMLVFIMQDSCFRNISLLFKAHMDVLETMQVMDSDLNKVFIRVFAEKKVEEEAKLN